MIKAKELAVLTGMAMAFNASSFSASSRLFAEPPAASDLPEPVRLLESKFSQFNDAKTYSERQVAKYYLIDNIENFSASEFRYLRLKMSEGSLSEQDHLHTVLYECAGDGLLRGILNAIESEDFSELDVEVQKEIIKSYGAMLRIQSQSILTSKPCLDWAGSSCENQTEDGPFVKMTGLINQSLVLAEDLEDLTKLSKLLLQICESSNRFMRFSQAYEDNLLSASSSSGRRMKFYALKESFGQYLTDMDQRSALNMETILRELLKHESLMRIEGCSAQEVDDSLEVKELAVFSELININEVIGKGDALQARMQSVGLPRLDLDRIFFRSLSALDPSDLENSLALLSCYSKLDRILDSYADSFKCGMNAKFEEKMIDALNRRDGETARRLSEYMEANAISASAITAKGTVLPVYLAEDSLKYCNSRFPVYYHDYFRELYYAASVLAEEGVQEGNKLFPANRFEHFSASADVDRLDLNNKEKVGMESLKHYAQLFVGLRQSGFGLDKEITNQFLAKALSELEEGKDLKRASDIVCKIRNDHMYSTHFMDPELEQAMRKYEMMLQDYLNTSLPK